MTTDVAAAPAKPVPPPGQDLLGPAWGKDPGQAAPAPDPLPVLVSNPDISPAGLSFGAQ